MKAWRVMVNNLRRGTDVHLDGIPSDKEAKKICRKMQKLNPDEHYFVQQYEEARAGKNVLSESST